MVRPRKELDVVQAFRAPRILTVEQACRRLHASRSTVLRRLNEQGMAQAELARLLGVRTHNTLLELVEEKRIRRERLGSTFVYLSRKASIRGGQVRRRRLLLAEPKKPRPTSRQIIATLLELIKDPVAERQQIALRCQRSGVSISRELVDGIFEKYDLDKKRAP